MSLLIWLSNHSGQISQQPTCASFNDWLINKAEVKALAKKAAKGLQSSSTWRLTALVYTPPNSRICGLDQKDRSWNKILRQDWDQR